jgi:serine/threonine protein kinase
MYESCDISNFAEGYLFDSRYLIREKLGEGGFAVTWRCRDFNIGIDVALKIFKPIVDVEMVRNEFRASFAIHHERCARVLDMKVGPNYGHGLVVFAYIEGKNLESYVASLGSSLDAESVRAIGTDVLTALDHIHSNGLVHRDISPRNIMVDDKGRGVLIDFGFSVPPGQMTIVGTRKYMAPERYLGHAATLSSDLYSLAVSLLDQMVVGLVGGPTEKFVFPTDNQLHGLSQLDTAMISTLFGIVSASPESRPDSAAEFIEILRTVEAVEVLEGSEIINPVVSELNNIRIGNPGALAFDSDFSAATYVQTKLDTVLLSSIVEGRLSLVLLTGNPGDGKTTFLQNSVLPNLEKLDGFKIVSKDRAGWTARAGGHLFVAVYDASESHDEVDCDQRLVDALASGDINSEKFTLLVAVNDGRLDEFFTDYEDRYEFADDVRNQLRGSEPLNERIVVIDLKGRSLANSKDKPGLGVLNIEKFVREENWQCCSSCLSRDVCPILGNVKMATGPAKASIAELLMTSHLRRRRRATFRDLRSSIAFLLTGDRGCEEIHEARRNNTNLIKRSDANLYDLAFYQDSNDGLIREWSELDPGRLPVPSLIRLARARFVQGQFSDGSELNKRRFLRRIFFSVNPEFLGDISLSDVRAYRYFGEYVAMLNDRETEDIKSRLLLGISRLAGATGFRAGGLAVRTSDNTERWTVIKVVKSTEFEIVFSNRSDRYVEYVPDHFEIRHMSGAKFGVSLDSAELLLRAADGEIFSDFYSDSIVQEVQGFTDQIRRSNASEVCIVDPIGNQTSALRSGPTIKIGDF